MSLVSENLPPDEIRRFTERSDLAGARTCSAPGPPS